MLCVRNVSVHMINDRVQKHMRAMPNPLAQHTCTKVTAMGKRNQENDDNEDGIVALLNFLKSLNESGCPPHVLKL